MIKPQKKKKNYNKKKMGKTGVILLAIGITTIIYIILNYKKESTYLELVTALTKKAIKDLV